MLKNRILVITLLSAVSITHLSAQTPERFVLLSARNGAPVWVKRSAPVQTLATRQVAINGDAVMASAVSSMIGDQLAGATSEETSDGLVSLFPSGTRIDAVDARDGRCTVSLTFPAGWLEPGIDDPLMDNFSYMAEGIRERSVSVTELAFLVRELGQQDYRPLADCLKPRPPRLKKPGDDAESTPPPPASASPLALVPADAQAQPTGALSGASIFLNPGHGWYYASGTSSWTTQRGVSYELIEDLNNVDVVMQYLEHYLWNAGARVYTCRERDLNTNMVIVDTAAAAYTGTWTAETASGTYGTDMRYAATVTGTPTATATFTPNIPKAGYYSVYVWYRKSAAGTTTADAQFVINHTGGSSTWVQDQNHDGYSWKYVGTYYFEAGSSATAGSVVINNLSGTAGNRVIADAVRFGGGMGDVKDDVSGTISGKPRFEESGRYYAAFMGVSDWASYNQISGMPHYASWEHETWENNTSMYLAWHSNAATTPDSATGTESWAFATTTGGTFSGVAGGDILRNYLQAEMINDIRAGWDSGWHDRGNKTQNMGECNPSNNPDMPAALIETAFHDTKLVAHYDNQALLDPKFRNLIARAVYQGILKFYNNYRGTTFTNTTQLPEPPTNLRMARASANSVTISWNAPPYNTGNNLLGNAATGYRVYRSTNGKGFGNSVSTTGLSYTVTGLTAGQVYYFRVAASNAGGESFPTETLTVCCKPDGTNNILIVNGFDRIDGAANIVVNGTQRGFLWRMNTGDYVIAHASALKAAGYYFDSCSNEAVSAGQVNLNNYQAVVWILGEESTADKTFDANEQTAVQNYLAAGKNLMVSGSDIGYELKNQGVATSFYNTTLKADFVSNDAGVYAAAGASGSIFSNISSIAFDNGTSIYDVDSPDVITPSDGSTAAMTYFNGTTAVGTAAIQYSGAYKLIQMAFPFESITNSATRNAIMAATMTFFGMDIPSGVSDWTLY